MVGVLPCLLATTAMAGHDYIIVWDTQIDDLKEYTYTTIHFFKYGGRLTVGSTGELRFHLTTGSEDWGICLNEGDQIWNYGTIVVSAVDNYTGPSGISVAWDGANEIRNFAGGTFSVTNKDLKTSGRFILNEGTWNNAGIINMTDSAGSHFTNSGVLNNTGTINTSQTWDGYGTINNSGTVNINGGTFTSGVISGGTVNLSAGNATINQIKSNSRYKVTGGQLTTGINQIIADVGTQGQQELNYIQGTGSSSPQQVQTLLSDLFQKYIPGDVRKDLNASFTGGKIILTGANLTTTQRDDLTKAFKETFGIIKTLNNTLTNHLVIFC